MADQSSERERNLRDLISAGSSDLKHYIELANIMYGIGQSEETLAILKQASDLDLPPLQRGLLLNEQAQFLFLLTTQKDEAVALAEQALSILSQQPQTPET